MRAFRTKVTTPKPQAQLGLDFLWHVPLLIVVSYRGIGPKSRLSKCKAQSSQKKSSILRSEAEGAELIDSVLDVVRKEAEGHGLAFKGMSFSLHV